MSANEQDHTYPAGVQILDEGVVQGRVTKLDFTGTGVTATVSGTTATIDASGGGSGYPAVLGHARI